MGVSLGRFVFLILMGFLDLIVFLSLNFVGLFWFYFFYFIRGRFFSYKFKLWIIVFFWDYSYGYGFGFVSGKGDCFAVSVRR